MDRNHDGENQEDARPWWSRRLTMIGAAAAVLAVGGWAISQADDPSVGLETIDTDDKIVSQTVEADAEAPLVISGSTVPSELQLPDGYVPGEPFEAGPYGCQSSDVAYVGSVSGVQEWAAVRDQPDQSASETDRADRGAELVYFPESVTFSGGVEWTEVHYRGACGWMAAKFILGADQSILGETRGIDWIGRVLLDANPEALHATVVVTDPADPESAEPFDDADLDRPIATLLDLETQFGPLSLFPDPTYSSGMPQGQNGCFFRDYLYCRVLLYDPSNEEVGAIEVRYVGDGVTAADVTVSADFN